MQTADQAEQKRLLDAALPISDSERLAFKLKDCCVRFVTSGGDKQAQARIRDEAERLIGGVFPAGTSIVINLATFEYVHGANRTAVLKAFIARFGKSALGWAFEVDRPMVVGGGACPS